MTTMFTRLVAEVKFLWLYTCCRCSVQAQGSTERISIDQTNVTELKLDARTLRPNPHHMPVGWASYTDGIRCPNCKG